MRHGKKINHLSRKSQHRHALLSNMATALITHKRINTTLAKAKALKKYFEPIITRAKSDTTHARRMVFRKLQNKEAVIALFRDVAPKVGERHGGYTRILKTEFRTGDNASMCLIELVDFNENMLKAASVKAVPAKKTRRSRAGKKKEEVPAAENTASESTDTTNTEEQKSE
ncbi:MAG: 50S ribosomal protein L17 [Bacteroidetes bacterium]|nr:50S ribosomal protein L17 [Bacteroidota bacterium]